MTITDLLMIVANGTNIRIRVLDVRDFTYQTGIYKTQKILDDLKRRNCHNAVVICIYPLFHAQELYIECTNVIQ